MKRLFILYAECFLIYRRGEYKKGCVQDTALFIIRSKNNVYFLGARSSSAICTKWLACGPIRMAIVMPPLASWAALSAASCSS